MVGSGEAVGRLHQASKDYTVVRDDEATDKRLDDLEDPFKLYRSVETKIRFVLGS